MLLAAVTFFFLGRAFGVRRHVAAFRYFISIGRARGGDPGVAIQTCQRWQSKRARGDDLGVPEVAI